jgi:hypothetical protein
MTSAARQVGVRKGMVIALTVNRHYMLDGQPGAVTRTRCADAEVMTTGSAAALNLVR